MSRVVRSRLTLAALGGLAGAIDGAVRGMGAAELLAASGWCAIAAGGAAVVATLVRTLVKCAWASEVAGLGRARAHLATAAIGAWAIALALLADRFALRFSARDVAALLWATLGVVLAACLALVLEPLARRVAARWPAPAAAARTAPARVLVPMALALALLGASVAAIVRGAPTQARSLGALAARGLGG